MSKKPIKQQADAKKRRNIIIASVIAVAVVAVAIVIVVGSGGDDKSSSSASGSTLQGVTEVNEMLDGIPQSGNSIGDPDAPVTVREFLDYQCPFCKAFALGPYPVIVNKYVRTGKVRWELQPLTFIGADSEKAARAAAAAGQQNRQGTFTDLFYFNQGEENSGYVTDEFIDKLYDASGVDKVKANAYRRSQASTAQTTEAAKQAEQFGVSSTPSFVLGKTGSDNFSKIDVSIDSSAGLEGAIDSLLKD